MPGSTGTGHPLTLRCAKCRKYRNWRVNDRVGLNLEATGRIKRVGRWTAGGVRQGKCYVQYRCLTCGHVGWTKHISGERLLLKWQDEQDKKPEPKP